MLQSAKNRPTILQVTEETVFDQEAVGPVAYCTGNQTVYQLDMLNSTVQFITLLNVSNEKSTVSKITLRKDADWVDFAVAHDGKQIFVLGTRERPTSNEGHIKYEFVGEFINTQSLKRVRLDLPEREFGRIVFSPDGKRVAIGPYWSRSREILLLYSMSDKSPKNFALRSGLLFVGWIDNSSLLCFDEDKAVEKGSDCQLDFYKVSLSDGAPLRTYSKRLTDGRGGTAYSVGANCEVVFTGATQAIGGLYSLIINPIKGTIYRSPKPLGEQVIPLEVVGSGKSDG